MRVARACNTRPPTSPKCVPPLEPLIFARSTSCQVYQALAVGSVPVYRGAPNIADFLPCRNCIVNADEFSSVEVRRCFTHSRWWWALLRTAHPPLPSTPAAPTGTFAWPQHPPPARQHVPARLCLQALGSHLNYLIANSTAYNELLEWTRHEYRSCVGRTCLRHACVACMRDTYAHAHTRCAVRCALCVSCYASRVVRCVLRSTCMHGHIHPIRRCRPRAPAGQKSFHSSRRTFAPILLTVPRAISAAPSALGSASARRALAAHSRPN